MKTFSLLTLLSVSGNGVLDVVRWIEWTQLRRDRMQRISTQGYMDHICLSTNGTDYSVSVFTLFLSLFCTDLVCLITNKNKQVLLRERKRHICPGGESTYPGGGGYLPWPGGGVPTLAGAIPTLAGGYLSWLGEYLPWLRRYLPWLGGVVPTPIWTWPR